MSLPNQIEAVQHQQLHEIVAERLREAILTGQLKPGEFIRQNHIAEEYGVSQIPVREALKDLTAEALVEHIPYRGVRVVKYSLDDLADLFALRSFLEKRAATVAAELISDEDINQLSILVEEMKSISKTRKAAAYRKLNKQFHKIIYLSSQRKYLIQNLDKLWSSYPTMIQGNFPQSEDQLFRDRGVRDYQEHKQIIDALKNRDAETAGDAIKKHVDHAGNELIKILQEEN